MANLFDIYFREKVSKKNIFFKLLLFFYYKFFASSAIGVSLPVFNGHGLKVGTCTQY